MCDVACGVAVGFYFFLTFVVVVPLSLLGTMRLWRLRHLTIMKKRQVNIVLLTLFSLIFSICVQYPLLLSHTLVLSIPSLDKKSLDQVCVMLWYLKLILLPLTIHSVTWSFTWRCYKVYYYCQFAQQILNSKWHSIISDKLYLSKTSAPSHVSSSSFASVASLGSFGSVGSLGSVGSSFGSSGSVVSAASSARSSGPVGSLCSACSACSVCSVCSGCASFTSFNSFTSFASFASLCGFNGITSDPVRMRRLVFCLAATSISLSCVMQAQSVASIGQATLADACLVLLAYGFSSWFYVHTPDIYDCFQITLETRYIFIAFWALTANIFLFVALHWNSPNSPDGPVPGSDSSAHTLSAWYLILLPVATNLCPKFLIVFVSTFWVLSRPVVRHAVKQELRNKLKSLQMIGAHGSSRSKALLDLHNNYSNSQLSLGSTASNQSTNSNHSNVSNPDCSKSHPHVSGAASGTSVNKNKSARDSSSNMSNIPHIPNIPNISSMPNIPHNAHMSLNTSNFSNVSNVSNVSNSSCSGNASNSLQIENMSNIPVMRPHILHTVSVSTISVTDGVEVIVEEHRKSGSYLGLMSLGRMRGQSGHTSQNSGNESNDESATKSGSVSASPAAVSPVLSVPPIATTSAAPAGTPAGTPAVSVAAPGANGAPGARAVPPSPSMVGVSDWLAETLETALKTKSSQTQSAAGATAGAGSRAEVKKNCKTLELAADTPSAAGSGKKGSAGKKSIKRGSVGKTGKNCKNCGKNCKNCKNGKCGKSGKNIVSLMNVIENEETFNLFIIHLINEFSIEILGAIVELNQFLIILKHFCSDHINLESIDADDSLSLTGVSHRSFLEKFEKSSFLKFAASVPYSAIIEDVVSQYHDNLGYDSRKLFRRTSWNNFDSKKTSSDCCSNLNNITNDCNTCANCSNCGNCSNCSNCSRFASCCSSCWPCVKLSASRPPPAPTPTARARVGSGSCLGPIEAVPAVANVAHGTDLEVAEVKVQDGVDGTDGTAAPVAPVAADAQETQEVQEMQDTQVTQDEEDMSEKEKEKEKENVKDKQNNNINHNIGAAAERDSVYVEIKKKLNCDNRNVEMKLFCQIFKDIGSKFFKKYIAESSKFELNIAYSLRKSFTEYFENANIRNYKFKSNIIDIIALIEMYHEAYQAMMQLLRFSFRRFVRIKDINALRDDVIKIQN